MLPRRDPLAGFTFGERSSIGPQDPRPGPGPAPVAITASPAGEIPPLPGRPPAPPLPEAGDSEPVVQAKMAAALRFYQQAYQIDGALIQALDGERRAWRAAFNSGQRTVEILATATQRGEDIGDRCAAVRVQYEASLSVASREITRQGAEIDRLRGQRNSALLWGGIGGAAVGSFAGYQLKPCGGR